MRFGKKLLKREDSKKNDFEKKVFENDAIRKKRASEINFSPKLQVNGVVGREQAYSSSQLRWGC